MFRNVLVPLDGSRFAEAALPLATRIVRAAGAKLHVVMVHQPIATLAGMGELVLTAPEFESELQSQERSYLAETAAGLSAASGSPVEFRHFDGDVAPDVCEEAGRVAADLVVIATHGRGTLKRLWLGSVADYVVRHLTVPVLLVHPSRGDDSETAPPVRRILVALDLSQEAEAILEPAVALAQVTGAALTLVHVSELVFEMATPAMPSPVQLDAELLQASRAAAQTRLEAEAARLRRLGVSVDVKVIVGVGAASGLLDLLEDDQFDVVAMTTHGRGGMRRLLLGSVADKVVRGSAKPVLVFRPHAPVL
jgi:nucleotide-binding universal stress UspA family protein